MTGIALIAAERLRQTEVEGYNAAHDDTHKKGEILMGAIAYATIAQHQTQHGRRADPDFVRDMYWPWDRGDWKPDMKSRINNLIKVGAMAAAEIDRIQREENK